MSGFGSAPPAKTNGCIRQSLFQVNVQRTNQYIRNLRIYAANAKSKHGAKERRDDKAQKKRMTNAPRRTGEKRFRQTV